MASTYARAALAGAAAAALLTTSTSGYAAWQSAHRAAPAGPSLEAGAVEVHLTSPGGEPRTVDAQAGVRAVVGDTVSVRMPVTIRTGEQPSAVLDVEVPAAAGDAPLATEFAAVPTSAQVTAVDGGPALEAAPGEEGAHLVTPASDGYTYLLEWRTSTRATRDGRAPGAGNGWGSGPESLQGLEVGTRPLTVSLTPAGDAAGSTTARAVVPPIRMDTTALRVSTAPGGSELTPLGGIPVSVSPAAVTLSPRAPLTDAGLTEMLEEGKAGVDILWGAEGCDAVRWSVPGGGFDGGTGRPTATGEATESLTRDTGGRLCTRLNSALPDDDFVQRFAGRTALARTQWESRTTPPATWVSTASTNALLTVPLPPAEAARQACSVGRSGAAIRWTWPSATSRPIEDAEGIARWTVNARPKAGGAWTRVAVAGRDGASRAHTVTARAMRAAGLAPGDYEVMVRGYPFEGVEDAYVDSAQVWAVSLQGSRLRCGATAQNAAAQTQLGGGR